MDTDEHTGGSKQERAEEQAWFDRDLKTPVVQAMMGEDFNKYF